MQLETLYEWNIRTINDRSGPRPTPGDLVKRYTPWVGFREGGGVGLVVAIEVSDGSESPLYGERSCTVAWSGEESGK